MYELKKPEMQKQSSSEMKRGMKERRREECDLKNLERRRGRMYWFHIASLFYKMS